jgi:hypothetical protein
MVIVGERVSVHAGSNEWITLFPPTRRWGMREYGTFCGGTHITFVYFYVLQQLLQIGAFPR